MKRKYDYFLIFLTGIGFMVIYLLNEMAGFSITNAYDDFLDFLLPLVFIIGLFWTIVFGFLTVFSTIRDLIKSRRSQ